MGFSWPSIRVTPLDRLTARAYKFRHQIWLLLTQLFARLRKGEHIFVVLTAILIGLAGAYGAIAFRLLIKETHQFFFLTSEYNLQLLDDIPWWRRLLVPTTGGLLVGLIVTRFAPEVKGSGIPEVMESVARRSGTIRPRVLATKAVAAALTIGSGGSAGREGPIVHIGSAIGSVIGQFLQAPARRLRTFVACGAAAAIAATFNAPISGALFSVEVVIGDLAVTSLSPIVIASVVATVVSRHHLGDFPAFRVPAFEMVSSQELLLYAGLGLLVGLMGAVFIKTLYRVGDFVDACRVPPWLRPALGGFCVGLIALWVPYVFGVGYETINAALWEKVAIPFLLGVVVAKLLATALTLGSGGSGGVFAPSLFVGATLGSAWGQFVHDTFPSWTASSSAYALVGMGALVSATTHAPITAILIIFELTNQYKVIPPLMLTCVVATLISGRLSRESIYTAKLARRGIRLDEGRDVNLLRSILVRETLTPDPPVIHHGVHFSEFVPRLLTGQYSELFVVDGKRRFVGTISISDIKAVLPDSEALAALVVAADIANRAVPFVLPDDNLDLVMHLFGKIHRDQLPVCTDADTREILGMVTRDSVIQIYNQRIFQMDLTGGFHSLIDGVHGKRNIEVIGGIQLTEIEVPIGLVGQTLKEANLRQTYEVEVLLIHTPTTDRKNPEARPAKLPGPDIRLQAGDRLLVMGTQQAISRLGE